MVKNDGGLVWTGEAGLDGSGRDRRDGTELDSTEWNGILCDILCENYSGEKNKSWISKLLGWKIEVFPFSQFPIPYAHQQSLLDDPMKQNRPHLSFWLTIAYLLKKNRVNPRPAQPLRVFKDNVKRRRGAPPNLVKLMGQSFHMCPKN